MDARTTTLSVAHAIRGALVAALAALALAGCGGDDEADTAGAGGDEPDAADARTPENVREGASARVEGLVYRVPLFRELNPNISPDDLYYDGPPANKGEGVYAAFVRVCNEDGAPRTPTGRVLLEDAFGEQFEPVPQPDNELAYDPRELDAEECLPGESSGSTAEGAVVAFRVPYEDVSERPLRLVVGRGEDAVKVALDV